jgi:hypothetical protein
MWLSSYISFVQSRPFDSELNDMAPERFFAFIPFFAFFAFWALGVGVVAETFLFLPRYRPLRHPVAWIMLGVAYSLVWVFYAIRVHSPWTFVGSYILAFAVALAVHAMFAEHRPDLS